MKILFIIACIFCLSVASLASDAPTVTRYFGEPVPGLSRDEGISFDRGALLFARSWEQEQSGASNALSCVACHSVPTPAGSGMTDRALVSINAQADAGSREEVIQREISHTITGELRRTPGLFGIGFLEIVEVNQNIGPFRIGAHNKQSDLREFVSSAFATELGVSTTKHCARQNTHSQYPASCVAKVTDREIDDVVSYLRMLAPPSRPSRITKVSESIFTDIGCSKCHVPTLKIGKSTNSRFAGKLIYPFTDLRAYDIGTSVRGPIRTAPLWGLNSLGPPYLHNGSADSIESAILAHHGEAENSLKLFNTLSTEHKQILVDYLRSF